MKRLISFALLIFVFLAAISTVSAALCVNDPNGYDTILKLAPIIPGTTNNAHGAIYSETDSDYTIGVCYSSLFSQAVPTTAPDRSCGANNVVVRLDADTNAHGQVPSVNTYTTDICYPGLSCSTISSGSCPLGSTAVVSLQSQTNSHLGIGGSYANKVCCSISGSPPTVPGINLPIHRGIYFVNELIDFKGGCSTAPGTPTYTWSVKQSGSTVQGLPPNPQPDSFQYLFNTAGQADIQLTCSYPSAPSVPSTTSEIGILVVASPGAFAYISKPKFNDIIYHSVGFAYPTEVQFSANDSYVVDVNGCNVDCLGGYCMQQTENSPTSACGGGQLGVNNAPTTPNDPGIWGSINFDWTFSGDDGWTYDGQGTSTLPNLDGPDQPGGYAYYNSKSNAVNDKHIDVAISYDLSGTPVTEDFTRDFTLGFCLNSGNNFLDSNGNQHSTSSTTGNYCQGLNPGSSADDCCPANRACLPGTGGNYYCQVPGTPLPDECSDFIDEDSCEDPDVNPSIPLNSLDPGQVLTQCQQANCVWSTANTCDVQVSQFSAVPGGQCGTTTPTSTCQYSTTSSSCVNGQKIISYTLSSSSPATCAVLPNQPVVCGDLNFELGFFDYWQFLATTIVIAFIYAAYLALGTRKHEE